eukprot:3623927-Prymnesium_polylepis.2
MAATVFMASVATKSTGPGCAAGAPTTSAALGRARALAAELPDRQNASMAGGEAEMATWWYDNDALLREARVEYGPLHAPLYSLQQHEAYFIQPELRAAVASLEAAAAGGGAVNESAVRSLLQPTGVPGVWRLPIFTPLFCRLLIDELRHYEESGIPLRRPNGMNRFGAILDQLGLEDSMTYLSRRYLRPLGQLLFPWLISDGDADEHYAFAVRYKLGEDVARESSSRSHCLSRTRCPTRHARLGLSVLGSRAGSQSRSTRTRRSSRSTPTSACPPPRVASPAVVRECCESNRAHASAACQLGRFAIKCTLSSRPDGPNRGSGRVQGNALHRRAAAGDASARGRFRFHGAGRWRAPLGRAIPRGAPDRQR